MSSAEKKIKNIKMQKTFVTFIIVVLVCMCLYIAYLLVNSNERVDSEYPTKVLSQSVFEYQNNEYETNINMSEIYYLYNGHYAYDMYDVEKANVGDTSFFNTSENIIVGVTSVDNAAKSLDVLKKDLKEAFDVSGVSLIEQENGYKNGWAVTYIVFEAKDASGKVVKGVAYVAKIEEGYFIVSAISSTATYDVINTLASDVYCSVRVPIEWVKFNETETTRLFVPESNNETTIE